MDDDCLMPATSKRQKHDYFFLMILKFNNRPTPIQLKIILLGILFHWYELFTESDSA